MSFNKNYAHMFKSKMPAEKPKPQKTKESLPGLLTGVKDILPQEQGYWRLLLEKLEKIAGDYGYNKIDLPIIEREDLFRKSFGGKNKLLKEEIFSFADRHDKIIVLRPEIEPSLARAYLEHGFINNGQLVKWRHYGPVFRNERARSDYLRQFYKFDLAALGEEHAIIEAQLIVMAHNIFKELGLAATIQLNNIGCRSCQDNYSKELTNYLRRHRQEICDDCRGEIHKDPHRLLACINQKCENIRWEAPQSVDWLCEECNNHFIAVLEYLDELDLVYHLNPYLIKPADYYSRIIFEVWSEDGEKGKKSLGRGGRYDDLFERLGGLAMPAFGFSLELEKVIAKIKDKQIPLRPASWPVIFVGCLGEAACRKAIKLYEDLRKQGLALAEAFARDSLKAQLEAASRLGVRYSLILGQKEILDNTVIIRDMEGGIQEVVAMEKLEFELKKRLSCLS